MDRRNFFTKLVAGLGMMWSAKYIKGAVKPAWTDDPTRKDEFAKIMWEHLQNAPKVRHFIPVRAVRIEKHKCSPKCREFYKHTASGYLIVEDGRTFQAALAHNPEESCDAQCRAWYKHTEYGHIDFSTGSIIHTPQFYLDNPKAAREI